MSDDAVLWKLAFGALVLVVCGLTVTLRKAPPAQPPVPARVAAPPPAREVPAPVDVQEDSPPRIEVAARDVRKPPRPQKAKARPAPQRKLVALRTHTAQRGPAPRRARPPQIHRVVASGPQYPFDRRDPSPGF